MSSHTITSLDHPKTGLERYKKYQPERTREHSGRISVQEHTTKKHYKAEQLTTFAGGKIIVIDGAYWGENIEHYFGEVKNTLLEGQQSLRKYKLFPEYEGVLYEREKIPGGYRLTHLGFYLVNPQALSKFTQEVLHN